jgi:gliding motility-associated protein GldL
MSANQSKFDIWWNSPKTKRIVGIFYSVGASIVIIGAMGKILHTSWGGTMLGLGMGVEAFLFLMGVFDKPHEEFDWNTVFDGKSDKNQNNPLSVAVAGSKSTSVVTAEAMNTDDMKKFADGIKNLTTTAEQLASLGTVVASSDKLVKNLDAASDVTGKFISSQESLNVATSQLNTSYQGITNGMSIVESNTKAYAVKVDEINKNLASINSIYEIQLKNIQAQSEGLNKQTEAVNAVSSQLNLINEDVQKMKLATNRAAEQTENFKTGTEKLSKQVADLNLVYGNMLNALN